MTFGDTYVVDGTNGYDGNDGTINDPFATIQKAIDVQTAETKGLGDVIHVMPGVYPEGLTGTLTKVSLIGVGGNWGNGPNAVVVYPTAASGLDEITTNQAEISNFTFVSPSASTTLPAVHFANMRWTTFNNNALIGGAAACVTGMQIGNEDAVATAANCDFNRIINNYIGTVFGAASEFVNGIKVGRVGYDAGASVKQCHSTIIENNSIFASTYGIYLGVYGGKANGTVIKGNSITSWEETGPAGIGTACIAAYAANFAMVVGNFCAQTNASAAITGFQAGNVVGNWTTQNDVGKNEAPIA
jgi:hypothetical protein